MVLLSHLIIKKIGKNMNEHFFDLLEIVSEKIKENNTCVWYKFKINECLDVSQKNNNVAEFIWTARYGVVKIEKNQTSFGIIIEIEKEKTYPIFLEEPFLEKIKTELSRIFLCCNLQRKYPNIVPDELFD